MRRLKHVLLGICVLAAGVVRGTAGADFSETLLPAGAKAVWDLDKAFRETTYSRERICINGLWQWQPSSAEHARRGDATECRPDVVLRHQRGQGGAGLRRKRVAKRSRAARSLSPTRASRRARALGRGLSRAANKTTCGGPTAAPHLSWPACWPTGALPPEPVPRSPPLTLRRGVVKDRPSRLFSAQQETVQRSLGGTGSALSWWLKCGRRDAACC